MNKWLDLYKEKLTSPEEALNCIASATSVIMPLANGQPQALLNALGNKIMQGDLQGMESFSGVDLMPNKYFTPEVADKGTIIDSGFLGPLTRPMVQAGYFTHSPGHLSDSANLIMRCRPNFETAILTVSPMDKHGFFSTGTNTDYCWEVAKYGPDIKNIILEVNENMPRTYGRNFFHITEVTALVENNAPLVEIPMFPPQPEDEAIAHYIADEIPDNACMQLGIGALPNLIASYLKEKKDLSIHSEMLVDGMVDLYEHGVITSAKKNFMPNKWVAAFAMGSKKLYDFIDDNMMIEMQPSSYVVAPHIACLNDNLISINATLEVDLTGQCVSESIGPRPYSGSGGQADFVKASWWSKGGKSFLTCSSTYKDKEGKLHSKIVPTLTNGGVVTVTRPDVQNVVTEYGIAALKGQTIRTRVERLINIAHPDFRDELRFQAKKLNFI